VKVIIAGSRSITSYATVEEAVKASGFEITEVVSGKAIGVDKLGEEYALKHGIPCALFPADWAKYGKSAGFKRNQKMAEYADGLVAVWDGKSHGTAHMVTAAKAKNLKVYLHKVEA